MKIADLHCDTLSCLYYLGKPSLKDSDGHLNTGLLKKGGYTLQNFAAYLEKGRGPYYETCLKMIDRFELELKDNADVLAPVRTYSDIVKNERAGRISAVLTVEDGAAIEGDVSRLGELYRRGVRMMSITWNHRNELGSPNHSMDGGGDSSGEGLTKTGIAAVREMERLGMVPDVSHLSDAGFWDVLRYTKAPFAASHSSCRALCGHARNLTDEMLRALADRGGVAGVNFNGPFLGRGRPSFAAAARHIKHMIDVAGEKVAALGSDFDGIEDAGEIGNAGRMQLLIPALEKAGLKENQIERVMYKNVLELYRGTLVENPKSGSEVLGFSQT